MQAKIWFAGKDDLRESRGEAGGKGNPQGHAGARCVNVARKHISCHLILRHAGL